MGDQWFVCVCVCVCVHHINRSGINLMINNPPRKQKCGCRSGPWSAGQEGKRETKGAAPGYRMRKKQFPQEAKSNVKTSCEISRSTATFFTRTKFNPLKMIILRAVLLPFLDLMFHHNAFG